MACLGPVGLAQAAVKVLEPPQGCTWTAPLPRTRTWLLGDPVPRGSLHEGLQLLAACWLPAAFSFLPREPLTAGQLASAEQASKAEARVFFVT